MSATVTNPATATIKVDGRTVEPEVGAMLIDAAEVTVTTA